MTNGITVFADAAWTPGGWARNLAITVNGKGDIVRVDAKADYEPELMTRLPGPAIPGIVNLHSHAHQRAMAGMSEHRASGNGAQDSFWTWRDVMHRFAEALTPEILEIVATQLYVEMVKAGFTAVCEFHYMHHDRDGVPYADPAEMSMALIRAATRAGIGITLLPVLYSRGGYAGKEANAGQKRFISTPDALLKIIENVRTVHRHDPQVRIGVAPHSPRQVTLESMRDVLAGMATMDPAAPVHIHVAEQEVDVADSLGNDGLRPVEWVFENFEVNAHWCLVHATHLSTGERTRLAKSGAVAGLCPTTEANLGDGLFPLIPYLAEGGRFGVGSDSHVSVSLVEELRWMEYGQRLTAKARNLAAPGPGASTAVRLYADAVRGGAQAAARATGAIAPGMRADFVVLDPAHPVLIGKSGDKLIDSLVFAGNTSAVREVWIGGKRQVTEGRHVREQDTLDMFAAVMRGLDI